MCRVYKPHKGDMLEKNTLPPILCMQPEKGLYNRHDRLSQSFINFLEEKITHKNIVSLYNRHDRSSQSFFNFLEQKITHKNIVYKLAKQGSQGLYNRHDTTMTQP